MANSPSMTGSSLGKRKRDDKPVSTTHALRSPIHKQKALPLLKHLDSKPPPSRVSMFTLLNPLSPNDLGAAQMAGPVGQPLFKVRRIISFGSGKRDRRPLRETSLSAANGACAGTGARGPPSPRREAREGGGGAGGGLTERCHMCFKAPRLKRDLDGYEDCWRCRRRTCYVCVRVCETGDGPGGGGSCGGSKICRACCVEVGAEGHVFCLDCFGVMDDCQMGGCA